MSEPVDLVRKLVALSLFNENANEARSALSQARKLIAKHDIKQDALFMPDGEAKGWSPADFMQAAEKAKDVLAVGKAALSDPEVQKTLSAAKDIGSGIASLLKKVRRRG